MHWLVLGIMAAGNLALLKPPPRARRYGTPGLHGCVQAHTFICTHSHTRMYAHTHQRTHTHQETHTHQQTHTRAQSLPVPTSRNALMCAMSSARGFSGSQLPICSMGWEAAAPSTQCLRACSRARDGSAWTEGCIRLPACARACLRTHAPTAGPLMPVRQKQCSSKEKAHTRV